MNLTHVVAIYDVRLASVGKRHFLFLPQHQNLFLASAATVALWPRLQVGLPVSEFIEAASQSGGNGPQILQDLLDAGAVQYLAPRSGPLEITSRLCLAIDGHHIGLSFTGEKIAPIVQDIFTHLVVPVTATSEHLIIVEEETRVGLAWVGEDLDWYDWHEFGAALKFLLTNLVLESSDHLVLHAGTLSADTQSLLLCGDPGSGKSTLSVALAGEGFCLEGDDLAVLMTQGEVKALPFPATLKSDALPVLASRLPGLEDRPSFVRPDGKVVRYLALAPGDCIARPVRCVLFLNRSGDAAPGLQPIMAEEEAFQAILSACWSPDDRLTNSAFDTLVALVNSARFFRITFDTLDCALALTQRAWRIAEGE